MRTTRKIPKPTLEKFPETSFTPILKQLLTGLSLLMIAKLLRYNRLTDNGNLRHTITTTSSYFIVNTCNLLFEKAIVKYYRPKAHRRATSAHMKQHKLQVSRYLSNKKKQNILLRAFFIVATLYTIYAYFRAWANLPDDISAFSLIFPDKYKSEKPGLINAIFHRPVTVPIASFLFPINLVYNIKEFYLIAKEKNLRQGDAPFFALLNGAATTGFTAFLLVTLLYKTEYSLAFRFYSIYFFSWFNGAAAYKVHHALLQLLTNIIIFSTPKPKIEIVKTPTQEKPKNKQRQYKDPALFAAEHSGAGALDADNSDHGQERHQSEWPSAALRPQKVKTRGKADKRHSKKDEQKSTAEPREIIYKPRAHIRRDALDLIAEYRGYTQIKDRHINALQSKLLAFLPEGARIIDSTGSERILTWDWNSKTYRIKFEVPHGTNSEYKGRKLHKILNVLETGFLWGWGEANIQRHLDTHSKSHLFGSLLNILFRRPTYDEQFSPSASM